MLNPDPLSGDYGPNFFGHAWNTATYVVEHPEFGWLSFGGNIHIESGIVKITPLDSAHNRVYLAPFGLWLTLNAGNFQSIELNPKTASVRVGLAPAGQFTSEARLHIEQPVKVKGLGTFHPAASLNLERNDYVVPLTTQETWVEIKSK